MTLEQIAEKQIMAMTEQAPFITRLISTPELITLTMCIFEQVYNQEEKELLVALYSSPVGERMLNKSASAAQMGAQVARKLVLERMEGMTDEEKEDIFEEIALHGME